MTRARASIATGRRPAARTAHDVVRRLPATAGLRRFFHENGLSIAFVTLFLLALFAGQGLAGLNDYNKERRDHGLAEVGYAAYLGSPHFIEALAENWESEFLEMMLFATLTALLFQKGSAESKELDKAPEDEEAAAKRQDAPWPVRRGGWIKELYAYSLSLAFLVLLVLTFLVHAVSGARRENEENLMDGKPERVTAIEFVSTSRFWYQSFQNWQSELLGISSMVLFSIWLRHRGSPESKAVGAPHWKTGKA